MLQNISTITALTAIFGVIPIFVVQAQNYQGQINVANGRITAVNQTASANKQRIIAVDAHVIRVQNELRNDVAYLNSVINRIVVNLTTVQTQQDAERARLDGVIADLIVLASAVADANDKIAKLQSVNVIWQQNFNVVDKTFTELRRKVKFVVPGGVRLMPVVLRPRLRGR